MGLKEKSADVGRAPAPRRATTGRSDLIERLSRVGVFGIGSAGPPDASELQELIREVETALVEQPTLELRYRLATAIMTYVFFHVRGDARVLWLNRADGLLRQALAEAERLGSASPVALPEVRAVLSRLLVESPTVRDLATAEKQLRATWKETTEYRPELCSLVSAVYKQGRYAEAAELALELHQRATKDSEWCDNPPPAATARS